MLLSFTKTDQNVLPSHLFCVGYKLSPASMANTENAILTTHRMVESFKFAYAGRSFLGDEDFVDVKEVRRII